MTPRQRIPSVIPLIALGLAACSHGESYALAGFPADSTFDGTARLTYSPGVDRDPVWLPDESGILYSSDRVDRDDNDRCLVVLPPAGGRITRVLCNDGWDAGDSLNALDAPSPGSSGRVAMVRASRPIGALNPRYLELAAGALDDVAAARTLLALPYTLGGVLHNTVSQIRWVSPDTLVFRADFAANVCIGAGAPCPLAFVTSGLDLETHPAADSGAPTVLASTALASSVAVAPGTTDAIYYTLQRDNRVYRRVMSSGITTVFYTFPAGTVARDVQVAGSRLVAITGGAVQVLDPAFNPPGTPSLQWDQGGDVTFVDLVAGTVSGFIAGSANLRFLHPALSPSGSRVVVEGAGDLWLFDVP